MMFILAQIQRQIIPQVLWRRRTSTSFPLGLTTHTHNHKVQGNGSILSFLISSFEGSAVVMNPIRSELHTISFRGTLMSRVFVRDWFLFVVGG